MLAACIFAISELAADSYRANIGFTFIFVGSGTVRKGFDFILESMERLLSEGLSSRLSVAGGSVHDLGIGEN
jgi:glycogen synthase